MIMDLTTGKHDQSRRNLAPEPILKCSLRSYFLQIRTNLSEERRAFASKRIKELVLEQSRTYQFVASFASFRREIDMGPLNELLAFRGQLLLPRRVGALLQFYQVTCLTRLTGGSLKEPSPFVCQEQLLDPETTLLLVPGLGFSSDRFRLGYGKGFYDQVLTAYPFINSYGVGFIEQLSEKSLSYDLWDRPVKHLMLV